MKYFRVQFFGDENKFFHNQTKGLVAEITIDAVDEKEAENRATILAGKNVHDSSRVSVEEIHGIYCGGLKGGGTFVVP